MQSRGGIALGAGYALILGLLICSTVVSVRLERALSDHKTGVYNNHLQLENAITQVRDAVYLGDSGARDYLRRGSPDFRQRVSDLEARRQSLDPVLPGETKQRFAAFVAGLRRIANEAPPSGDEAEKTRLRIAELTANVMPALDRASRDGREYLRMAEASFEQRQEVAVWRLFVILGGCLLAGFVTAWLMLRHIRRWQRERGEHLSEVERLSARLIEVQEDERRMLSRELHDGVGQLLTAIQMELSPVLRDASDPQAAGRLQRAHGLTGRTIRTVRDITAMLRPSLLDDLGLKPALEWHVQEFRTRSGIETEFHVGEGLDDLPEDLRTCVYRVTQEALNNCEKYSGASRAGITVLRSEERLVVEVRDNGRGFDPRECSSHGAGLLGIRERAAQLGGTARIDTKPGKGFRLVVTLPLAGIAEIAGAATA
ncbi:MAG: sensor histidine kinase [Acidobacteriota bacterium]|nr:sensor histidine kinase [Acidobacteriota bacterium]